MNFDPVSFILGAASAGVAFYFHGFLSELGKASAHKVKEKFFPEPAPEPEPILVDGTYEKHVPPGTHAWIGEHKLYKMERGGYTYHREPTKNAKVYRRVGGTGHKEFLMKKPPGVS